MLTRIAHALETWYLSTNPCSSIPASAVQVVRTFKTNYRLLITGVLGLLCPMSWKETC